jgi:hypothetical protein
MADATNKNVVRTTEAGFIALIALAIQKNEDAKEITDTHLAGAKMLFNRVFRDMTE